MSHPATAALHALSDPTRQEMVRLLREHPRTVGELAEALPVSRPAVSKHLRVLERAELVRDTPQGTRRIYRLRPEGAEAIRQYLNEMWDVALARFQLAAENTYSPKERK